MFKVLLPHFAQFSCILTNWFDHILAHYPPPPPFLFPSLGRAKDPIWTICVYHLQASPEPLLGLKPYSTWQTIELCDELMSQGKLREQVLFPPFANGCLGPGKYVVLILLFPDAWTIVHQQSGNCQIWVKIKEGPKIPYSAVQDGSMGLIACRLGTTDNRSLRNTTEWT